MVIPRLMLVSENMPSTFIQAVETPFTSLSMVLSAAEPALACLLLSKRAASRPSCTTILTLLTLPLCLVEPLYAPIWLPLPDTSSRALLEVKYRAIKWLLAVSPGFTAVWVEVALPKAWDRL